MALFSSRGLFYVGMSRTSAFTKNYLLFVLLGVSAILFVLFLYGNGHVEEDGNVISRDEYVAPKSREVEEIHRLRAQRAELSKRINSLMRDYSRMSCMLATRLEPGENIPEVYVGAKLSKTGSWCYNESLVDGGLHMTDSGLVKALSNFLRGKRVASFGDGPGEYKRRLDNSGKLAYYHSFDGSPWCEETSSGVVNFLDLTVPHYGFPVYDWIVSLEVAEHIPRTYESVFIDNIRRHALEGVILSWGVVDQIGFGHVNNRPREYVKGVMDDAGFQHDPVASFALRNASDFWHFRGMIKGHEEGNVQVYRRKQQAVIDLDDA